VAIVMDGNGRWAQRRGLPRTEGHGAGEEALFDTVEGAIDVGLKWMTVYAFSTENWKRPKDEVRYLMNFNESLLVRRRDELDERNVRMRFLGRRDWRVPKRILRRMDESVELTKDNNGMTLTIAFNYGGRAEIVDAVRQIAAAKIKPDKIDERTIQRYLYDPEMPDPDLMIRTSGEYRISNYLLWEIAYSELIFTDVLWPDFRREHLFDAVREYQSRNRRFGGIEAAG
jgi:undecaprenyl diphosphate synthase